MDKKKRSVLTIKNPPQYGVSKEGPQQITDSIFREVYLDSLKDVYDIIRTNEKINAKDLSKQTIISPEQLNPTIAFVGKRGSGKSTAMCSFAELLSCFSVINDNDFSNGPITDKMLKTIKQKSFYALDVIDSAQLGVKETIVGRISAAMYSQYDIKIRKYFPQVSAEKKRNFIKILSDVNQHAVMYHTGEWFERGESLLQDTCNVSSIRNEVSKLVEEYLKFMSGKENIADEYLVVCIDDLDMGIENSYSIMEEIRKFLCIPNVIVLLTLRMDQIHIALKTKFEKQLDVKIELPADKDMLEDLAYRYTEKLFPYGRQRQMPTITQAQLVDWIADFREYDADKANYDESGVLYCILGMIWRKTLMVLVCNEDEDHLIIPRNLRSLCNFVSFLQSMPNIDYEKIKNADHAEFEKLSKNIAAFAEYLVVNVSSFEQEFISEEDRKMAYTLTSVVRNMRNISLLQTNSYIVGEILYYLRHLDEKSYYKTIFTVPSVIQNPKSKKRNNSQETVNIEKEESTILEILIKSSAHSYSISLGDLMYVLGKIDSQTRCWQIKYLIEVIRTLWSARMTYEYFVSEPFNENYTFYKVIGNLIVNPDEGFFKSKSQDFEYTDSRTVNNIPYCVGSIASDYLNWRDKRNIFDWTSGSILHPLAPLTNIEYKTQIPFYSFDFVYNFCAILQDKLETVVADNEIDFNKKVFMLYGNHGAVDLTINEILSKVRYCKPYFKNTSDKKELSSLKTYAYKEQLAKLNRCTTINSIVRWFSDIKLFLNEKIEKEIKLLLNIGKTKIQTNESLQLLKTKIRSIIMENIDDN